VKNSHEQPPSDDSAPNTTRPRLRDLFLALRPTQWTKNAIILAAIFFAKGDQSLQQVLSWQSLIDVLIATALFCIVSSGIYVLNDIVDIQADRNHPTKRKRPIAAGRVSLKTARVLSLVLLVIGSIGATWLSSGFFFIVAAYILTQLAYSFLLKRIALIDIILIAIGFVLRAIAGAVVIDVRISPWLLLCTFLLALFLALCKRRHEKIALADLEGEQRASLENYDPRLLDQLIAIVSGATIVSYAMYTLSPDTTAKFGTNALGFTIPLVIFGIFRYLDLVYRHKKGDRPEKILLTDLPILVNIALYAVSIVIIFLFCRSGTI